MSQGAFPSFASLRPMRFGVLCDGPKIPTWQARSIEELRRVPGTSLALVVLPADKLPDDSRPTILLFRAYVASHPPRALRPVDMALAFQGVPSLRCHTTTQDGLAHRFAESAPLTWIFSSNAGWGCSMARFCARRVTAYGRFRKTTNLDMEGLRRVSGPFTTGTRSPVWSCGAPRVASTTASHSEAGTFGRLFTPSDKTLTRCTSGSSDGRPTCVKTSSWARPRTSRARGPLRRSPRRVFLRTVR